MRIPADLAAAGRGRAFWRWATSTYELERNELVLLRELARTLDRVDELRALVSAQGTTVAGSKGQLVLHPAIAEERMQVAAAARLLGQLELPDAEAPAGAGGSKIYSLASIRGSCAARARWRRTGSGIDGPSARVANGPA